MQLIPAKIKRFLFFLAMIYIVLVGCSYFLSSSEVDEKHQDIALAEARSFFQAIVAMRAWNADFGGLYVPLSAKISPNPYLDDPLRDITTTGGIRPTKVNPAFMTRLVSKRIQALSGILIHITSLKPLRPANHADRWETTALLRYERSGQSSWTFQQVDQTTMFRFMDGLRVDKTCLPCHAKQGYRVGDVRGGISVSIPYLPFARAARAERLRLAGIHGFFLLLGLGILGFVGRRLIQSVEALEASRATVRTLEGMLPICSFCKKIRREDGDPDNQDDWQPMEAYISSRAEVGFSHSICPECLKEQYPDE